MYDDSYYILKSNNGGVKDVLVATSEVHNNLTSQINTHINNYCNNVNPNSPLVNILPEIKYCTSWHLITENVIHSIITHEQFQNVLIIPTFKDSRHSNFILPNPTSRLVGQTHRPNIGNHLLPVINKVFDTSSNMYVAYPTEHVSLYKYIMEQYDINIITSNKMYTELGLDDYTITPPEGVKFDLVVILGADHDSDEKFNIVDLKADFAEYCTSDFVLFDNWISPQLIINGQQDDLKGNFDHPYRINGERRDISEVASWISSHYMSKQMSDSNYHEQNKTRHVEYVINKGTKIYQ